MSDTVQHADQRRLPSGVVTFLLTDIVGSTRMWESAPDIMVDALERHDFLMQSTVESHGGFLLKSKGEGDSTFCVFGRASDAVAAARDAQRAIALEPWPQPTRVRVRMAIHTGEAVERTGDYFGRTVNRAARLRALADPEQVLVSASAAELVADNLPDECSLLDRGVRQLRDLDRPENVFELVHAGFRSAQPEPPPTEGNVSGADDTGVHEAVPFPPRLQLVSNGAFAGRSTERKRLADDYALAAGGACRVALIDGEPGIGKTRLATLAAADAFGKGATVLFGRCDEDISVPYRPWIEALTHLVRNSSAETLRAVGDRKLADLAGLVREVGDRVPLGSAFARRDAENPETDRYLLFAAVVGLLAEAAEVAPVVLVVDDVHWADRPTLLLLRHVLQWSASTRLFVVLTFRDSEVSISPHLSEFLGSLHRETEASRVTLGGLVHADVVRWMENAAGHALDRDQLELARLLHRDTDGNPFFAGEVLRHLRETGFLVRREDHRWSATAGLTSLGLPQTVLDVIRQRVARLGGAAQQVLSIGSVIGREFELDLLAAVSGQSEDELIDALELARIGSLVHEVAEAPGRYAFVHALIQQTLYDEIGPTRRRATHRTVAETLERLRSSGAHVEVAEVAQHWVDGARSADFPHVVEVTRAAGDTAAAALAPDEAARWYNEALSFLGRVPDADDGLRTDLLISLGTTQFRFSGALLDAARLARSRDDRQGLIKAVLSDASGGRSRFAEVDQERLSLVEAAIAAAGEGDSIERARLLKIYARDLSYVGDNARCQALDAEAVAVARRVGDQETLLFVLTRHTAGFWGPETLPTRLAASREAVRAADALGDPTGSFWAYSDLWYAAMSTGERGEIDLAAEGWEAAAGELGVQPGLDWIFFGHRSTQALLSSACDLAETLAREAHDRATLAGLRRAGSLLLVQLGGVLEQRGDDSSLIPTLSERVSQAPLIEATHALLVRALINSGDRAQAAGFYGRALEQEFPAPADTYWLSSMCWWAECAALLGDAAGARILHDRLLAFRDQIVVQPATTTASVSLYLARLAALLGEAAAADRLFADALAAHRRLRSPYWTAATLMLFAEHLLSNGADDEGAQAMLAEAVTTAREFGFTGVEAKATALTG